MESEATMKKSIRILFVTACMAVYMSCLAQSPAVTYQYDNCGNRIERNLMFVKSNEKDDRITDDGKGWIGFAGDSISGIQFSLYPNPTDGFFSIVLSMDSPSQVEVVLSTLGGAIIETRQLGGLTEEFDISREASGVYLLRLTAGQESKTWKIIKKN